MKQRDDTLTLYTGPMPIGEELIRLGITLDYPAIWQFERVLRDLIQNFYDSMEPDIFAEGFRYSYETGADATYTVTMKTQGHPFSYEWLCFIGGSTKTNSDDTYIGKYGEGFKICMLNLIRLGAYDIAMHSEDWIIRPCLYIETIDEQEIKMLGYRLSRTENDNITSLEFRGIPAGNKRWLHEALLHFYYPENPLFGKLLGRSDQYAVFSAGDMRVPCSQNLSIRGVLYVNGLARGRLPFPLFIMVNLKDSDSDSRKRPTFKDITTWEITNLAARLFDPHCSRLVLEILRNYWNDLPRSWYDCETWYYLICQLVRNVSSDAEESALFRQNHSSLYYIDREGPDRKKNGQIAQARRWEKERCDGDLVNPVFRLLGATSILRLFLEETQTCLDRPTPLQASLIHILRETAQAVFQDTLQIPIPDVWIGSEQQARMDPLRYSEKNFLRKKGFIYRPYTLQKIVMYKEQFSQDAFPETLLFFCERLLFSFGSIRSQKLNALFTHLGSFFMEHRLFITQEEQRWKQIAMNGQEKAGEEGM